MALLPKALRARVLKFVRWQDQHASLIGKLLLMDGLRQFNNHGAFIEDITYDRFRRPFINHNVDFNISHSGELVACAIIDSGIRIGLDIEKINPINSEDFGEVFTKDEWETIRTSKNPTLSFYDLWTKKEAILKAYGSGFHFPIQDVVIAGDCGTIGEHTWKIRKLALKPGYQACLATGTDDHNFKIQECTYT